MNYSRVFFIIATCIFGAAAVVGAFGTGTIPAWLIMAGAGAFAAGHI